MALSSVAWRLAAQPSTTHGRQAVGALLPRVCRPAHATHLANASGWTQRARTACAAAAGAADQPGVNIGPGASSTSSSSASNKAPPAGFANLELMIVNQLGGGPGGDWKQIEGCYVLQPPGDAVPKCLVHFIGGSFVGAAPQLTYRPLLEALAARGALVVAVPYATSFDHLRVADEVHFKFERCLKALGPQAIMLRRYGVGHSLGALLHALIASRYPIVSAGNVLMSFNNRPATDSIPLLSPLIAPNIRALGPILSQLATSPLRSGVEQWIDMLRGASPSIVKQIVPLLDQLTPIYLDIANGTKEFAPAPQESRNMIRQGYTVPRNLLLRFASDEIDETPQLASTLQSSAVASMLELTVKTLPGEHARPLQQDLTRISPDLAKVASQAMSQSESLIGQLGSFVNRAGLPEATANQLTGLAKLGMGVTNMIAQTVASTSAAEDIDALADEIGGFCGLPPAAPKAPPGALPAAAASRTAGGAAGSSSAGSAGTSGPAYDVDI